MFPTGLLVINKPSGMTSKDVSRRITKIVGKCKIGHVGTLDPIAEGVLPILFGKATRLQDYLLSSKKTYECEVFLGKATDTLDCEGQVVKELPYVHVTHDLIINKIKDLVGEQVQIPPLYSAVKYKGKPLYKYARENQGEDIPLNELKRKVIVYDFKLISYDGRKIKFSADVSKGTYIRVLAYELTKLLGTVGHVVKLVRTYSSCISIEKSILLEELLRNLSSGSSLNQFLIPLSHINLSLEKLTVLSQDYKTKLLQGQKLSLAPETDALDSTAFSKELLTSCEHKEVLLQDKNYLLFAIAELSLNNKGFSLKVKKGLI